MDIQSWLAFTMIALLATATPGPAALLVSINSLRVGFWRALLTVLGNVFGLLVMSALSVLGLSALLLQSTSAFFVLKVLGALYLVYMGIGVWRKGLVRFNLERVETHQPASFRLFSQGFLVAITNPKAIVFTTALFPQFIIADEPLSGQFMLLVSTFMSLSFICLSLYALLAQKLCSHDPVWLSKSIVSRLVGSTFIGAGCVLVTSSK